MCKPSMTALTGAITIRHRSVEQDETTTGAVRACCSRDLSPVQARRAGGSGGGETSRLGIPAGWAGRRAERVRTVGARSSLAATFVSRPPQRRTTWLRNARRANLLFSERTGRASAGVGAGGGVRPAMRGRGIPTPGLCRGWRHGVAGVFRRRLGEALGRLMREPALRTQMSLAAAKHAENSTGIGSRNSGRNSSNCRWRGVARPNGKRVPANRMKPSSITSPRTLCEWRA